VDENNQWSSTILIPQGDGFLDIFSAYTCCAWAGEFRFPVVVLCQFLVLAGNRFWLYILLYLEYNTVVVSC
jgi:hypothetical protein